MRLNGDEEKERFKGEQKFWKLTEGLPNAEECSGMYHVPDARVTAAYLLCSAASGSQNVSKQMECSIQH